MGNILFVLFFFLIAFQILLLGRYNENDLANPIIKFPRTFNSDGSRLSATMIASIEDKIPKSWGDKQHCRDIHFPLSKKVMQY